MPKMIVTKSITIDQKPEAVYAKIADMSQWTVWSPWLIVEPEAKVDVSADKKSYSWSGKRVGKGEMKVTAEKENASVDYDLIFLTPFKSFARVFFKLENKGDSTLVSWSMESKLPFFMFFMTKMMETFIGMDFDRGLKLLKDYVETGEIHSKLQVRGISELDSFSFIGIKRECKMDAIGTEMRADFEKLKEFFVDHPEVKAGRGLSIYHKWKISKGTTVYTTAMQVESIPADLPAGFVSGTIPTGKVHVIRHTGPYNHIGNAWTAQNMMQRAKEFRKRRGFHPFELYINSPENTAPNDLITEIYMGTK